jgi:hypothetical protein
MSKKSTQAARVRKQKITNFLALGFLVIMLLFFILYTTQNALLYIHTNSNELYEYSGHFELNEIRRHRNTAYRFTLDNGDTITANPDIMQYNQRIDDFSELHFLYTPSKNIIFFEYTAVEITTLDGTIIFLDKNDSISEAMQCIYLGIAFTVLLFAMNIVSWLCLGRGKSRKKKK